MQKLSPQENRVLQLRLEGLFIKEVAVRLRASERTIES